MVSLIYKVMFKGIKETNSKKLSLTFKGIEMEKSLNVPAQFIFEIKKLSNAQKDMAEKITELIIANENPNQWKEKIQDYIENPFDQNSNQVTEIQSIASEHQVNSYLASLLYHSQKSE